MPTSSASGVCETRSANHASYEFNRWGKKGFVPEPAPVVLCGAMTADGAITYPFLTPRTGSLQSTQITAEGLQTQ